MINKIIVGPSAGTARKHIEVIIVFVCDFFLTRPMELVSLDPAAVRIFDPVISSAFQNHDIPLVLSRKVRISVKGVKIVLLVALETKKGLLSRILF